MNTTSIRQTRIDRGMGLQQFADLMGIDKLEAISIEADDISGLLDQETLKKSLETINDPTVVIEPLDIEEGAINADLWTRGIAGRLENDDIKAALLERINAGAL